MTLSIMNHKFMILYQFIFPLVPAHTLWPDPVMNLVPPNLSKISASLGIGSPLASSRHHLGFCTIWNTMHWVFMHEITYTVVTVVDFMLFIYAENECSRIVARLSDL